MDEITHVTDSFIQCITNKHSVIMFGGNICGSGHSGRVVLSYPVAIGLLRCRIDVDSVSLPTCKECRKILWEALHR